jgi:hypothetical protein
MFRAISGGIAVSIPNATGGCLVAWSLVLGDAELTIRYLLMENNWAVPAK